MIKKIVCKYWNTKHKIGIDQLGNAIAELKDGKIVPCKKVVHMGSIHYIPKTTSLKISAKQLNEKNHIIQNFTLQNYCPF